MALGGIGNREPNWVCLLWSDSSFKRVTNKAPDTQQRLSKCLLLIKANDFLSSLWNRMSKKRKYMNCLTVLSDKINWL